MELNILAQHRRTCSFTSTTKQKVSGDVSASTHPSFHSTISFQSIRIPHYPFSYTKVYPKVSGLATGASTANGTALSH